MGIETALLAAGASASTAATAASVAGGIGSVFSGLSAVQSITGGLAAKGEAKRQASLATFQAQQQGAESSRVAQREATFAQEEANSTRRAQKVAYLKSGVSLEGSPLLVMEGTRARGNENVEEILRAGGASTGAAFTEGRIRATNAKASGREAFTSGLTGAASLFKSAF